MRDRGLSDIAEGQEEVFRCSQRQRTWAKATLWHPKLWCILVCPMVLTVVLLALVINGCWIRSFEFGVERQQAAGRSILQRLNTSSEVILNDMVQQLQVISAKSALDRISRFISQPPIVTKLNAETFTSLAVAEPPGVEEIFKILWVQISSIFSQVDYIFFASLAGGYISYERLPESFQQTFGAEFAMPRHWSASRCKECSYCPPAKACIPGKKIYYLVDAEGKFLETYLVKDYSVTSRSWFKQAEEAQGQLVWTDVLNHSSGHAQGMSAMLAVYDLSPSLVGVTGAEFTMNYLHRFMTLATGLVEGEQGFIVNEDGWILANSIGKYRFCYPWKNASSPLVQSTMRTLLDKYGSLSQLPKNQTDVSEEKQYMFTVQRGLSEFEAAKDWIVVIACRVHDYMSETWLQQASAMNQSVHLQRSLEQHLEDREWFTTLACLGIALLGGWLMACIGCAITSSLERISTEMLSLARLEFLPKKRREATMTNAWLLRLSAVGPMLSWGSAPSTDESDGDVESDDSGRCFTTPKEVVNIRESFAYMVAGLKSFARYMDPEIMRILVHSRQQPQLGMSKAEVTIFFSDVANFTTMAEAMEPEDFMEMLSEYLDEMSKIIMSKRGVVGEFIGDAIMAWWNVPISLGEHHTELAVDAAMAQQLRLAELRSSWQERAWPQLNVRMGLVKGEVLAGNIGSETRMKYGLVGDAVNLASRLEGLCKYYGVNVIAEETAATAPGVRQKYHMRPLDLVATARLSPVELWEVLAVKEPQLQLLQLSSGKEMSQEQLQSYVEGFGEVQQLFRAGRLSACQQRLQLYCEEFPEDRASELMLQRVQSLLSEDLPPNWSPVHHLVEK